MADTKKSNITKENNVNLEDIENAIGGNTTRVEKILQNLQRIQQHLQRNLQRQQQLLH